MTKSLIFELNSGGIGNISLASNPLSLGFAILVV